MRFGKGNCTPSLLYSVILTQPSTAVLYLFDSR
nr:MAG TPA: hypothetical protein [Caudoviricetes sp.]